MADILILTPKEIEEISKMSNGENNIVLKVEHNSIGCVYLIATQKGFLFDDNAVFKNITEYDSW